MSKKKQETISDIVAEMRVVAREHGFEQSDWADRIEAAYKRLTMPTPDQWTEIAKEMCESVLLKRENARLREEAQRDIDTVSDDYGRLARELRAENARLRAALKPVLDLYSHRHDYLSKAIYMVALESAISEVNRIYNEGGKSK